jgi:DNA polymerase III delta subunit
MPLSFEQEELCRRLETGRPDPSAAALIRQQAREIDELWDRLRRAYLAVRREMPGDELRREIEQLCAQLDRQRTIA